MISEVEIEGNRFAIDYFDYEGNFICHHLGKFELDESLGSVVLDSIYETNITGDNDHKQSVKILSNSQAMKDAIEEREQQLGIGKHKTKQP